MRRAYWLLAAKSLKSAYLRLIGLHLYLIGVIYLLPIAINSLSGKTSDSNSIVHFRAAFAGFAALIYLMLLILIGLPSAWRYRPFAARRKATQYVKVIWLLLYPILYLLTLFMLQILNANIMILQIHLFMLAFLIVRPAVLTSSFILSAILKSVLQSRKASYFRGG
jgi:hypothetical protein